MVCLSLLHYPLITYPNGYADWVVGSLAKKGTGTRWIDSVGQGGFKCPFEISYTNWKLWYGGQWNSGDGVSFTLESVQDFLIKLDRVRGVYPYCVLFSFFPFSKLICHYFMGIHIFKQKL